MESCFGQNNGNKVLAHWISNLEDFWDTLIFPLLKPFQSPGNPPALNHWLHLSQNTHFLFCVQLYENLKHFYLVLEFKYKFLVWILSKFWVFFHFHLVLEFKYNFLVFNCLLKFFILICFGIWMLSLNFNILIFLILIGFWDLKINFNFWVLIISSDV